ncbi:hypothetical protein AAHE18_11G169200 [Arachis hypogaea]
MEIEFKLTLNAYLMDLIASPIRSLADVIAFNKRHSTWLLLETIFTLSLLDLFTTTMI